MARYEEYENRKPIAPGSAVVQWTIGASTYTLTDQGDGTMTGHGSGEVSYYNGIVRIHPDPAPRPQDGPFSVTYDVSEGGPEAPVRLSQTETPINNTLNFDLDYAPVKPGTVVIRATMLQYPTEVSSGMDANSKRSVGIVIRDDGDGKLKRYGGGVNGAEVGTVNYTTGAVSLDARVNYSYQKQNKTN